MARYTDFFQKHPLDSSGRSMRDGSRRRRDADRRRTDRDFNEYIEDRDNDWELAPARRMPMHPPVSPLPEQTGPPDSPDRPRERRRRDSIYFDSDSESQSEAESSPEGSSPLWGTQTICNPAVPQKDITLHFEMTIEDDVQGCLEELARLKRLGWFKEALEYFDLNLKVHLDLPLVTIEYADLLVEQGAHNRLRELLNSKQLQPPRKSKIISGFSNDVNLYAAHFALLRRVSDFAFASVSRDELPIEKMKMVVEYIKQRVDPDFTPNIKENARVPLDATEIQIMRRHEQLCSADWHGRVIPGLVVLPRTQSPLYQSLLSEGRIWELCDIMHDAAPWALGPQIFPAGENRVWEDEDIPGRLLEDWSIEEYDPSTELALLSILVNMAYTFEKCDFSAAEGQKSRVAGVVLQYANSRAALIQKNSPELMRSRPYLQWCLAKERLGRYWDSPPRHKDFQVHELLGLDPWDIPISFDVKLEGPGWPPGNPRYPPNDILDGILRVSRENGDYKTEEDCLTEIICRTDSPGPLLDQLGDLQLSCGNNVGHLNTCLSKHSLVTNGASVQKLVRELKKSHSLLCDPPEKDIRLGLRFAESMVNNSLYSLMRDQEEELDKWRDISDNIYDAMESQSSKRRRNREYYESDDSDEDETGMYHKQGDVESEKRVQNDREIKRLEKRLERRRASAGLRTDYTDTPSWSNQYEDSTVPPAERETPRRPYYRERSIAPTRSSGWTPGRNHNRFRFRDRAELDKEGGEEYLANPDRTGKERESRPARSARVRLDSEPYRNRPTQALITDSKNLSPGETATRRSGSFTRQRPQDAGDQETRTNVGSEFTAGSSKVHWQGPKVLYGTESETDSDKGQPAPPENTNAPGRRVEVETGDESGKD